LKKDEGLATPLHIVSDWQGIRMGKLGKKSTEIGSFYTILEIKDLMITNDTYEE